MSALGMTVQVRIVNDPGRKRLWVLMSIYSRVRGGIQSADYHNEITELIAQAAGPLGLSASWYSLDTLELSAIDDTQPETEDLASRLNTDFAAYLAVAGYHVKLG